MPEMESIVVRVSDSLLLLPPDFRATIAAILRVSEMLAR
jgi:hypothetical protein